MAPRLNVGSCRLTAHLVLGTLLIAPRAVYSQDCNYVGGFSLRFPFASCPWDFPVQCPGLGPQSLCCPSGLSCVGNDTYIGNWCCSGSEDCERVAIAYAKCPSPDLSLWTTNNTGDFDNKLDAGAWCCKSGYKGVYMNDVSLASYQCTATTVTSLLPSYYWAESLSPTPCSVTATPTATPSTTGYGTAFPTNTNSTNAGAPGGEQNSSGMSGGAIAGASLGSVAGAALILAGAFFVTRRKRGSKDKVSTVVSTEEGHEKVEDHRYGSGQRSVSEMATAEPRIEMEGTTPIYELDGANGTFESAPDEHLSPSSTKKK
ncbi:hypothetical protein CT0861_00218 [Colletotrichum tofieldiae]|uniref:Uncharacterized protein n=1 Tax=Colletotrichum tofieldiae TaxID=708197 RepID=A0A161W3W1_9PEZI|nr:hypothetical protein CT0861_00218 [Colletotrichum tofieldiae]